MRITGAIVFAVVRMCGDLCVSWLLLLRRLLRLCLLGGRRGRWLCGLWLCLLLSLNLIITARCTCIRISMTIGWCSTSHCTTCWRQDTAIFCFFCHRFVFLFFESFKFILFYSFVFSNSHRSDKNIKNERPNKKKDEEKLTEITTQS